VATPQSSHAPGDRAKRGYRDWGRAALASPFALRREQVPTSPNFLDDTHLHQQHPDRLTTHRHLSHANCLSCGTPLRHHVPRTTLQLDHVFSTTRPRPPCLSAPLTCPLTRLQAIKTRRKKNVKKGIQFCLMVCGASGTGRTTFVNTLCGKKVLEHKESDDPTVAHVEEGVKIQPIQVGTWPNGVQRPQWAAADKFQNSTRKAPASRSPSLTRRGSVTRSTTRPGSYSRPTTMTLADDALVSRRLSDI
jgi:hypothetical protein